MLLVVEGLAVTRANLPVLHEISFSVAAGEVVSLVGANGAGKSTLLDTIIGMLRPDQGRIRLDGMRLDGRSPAEVVGAGVVQVPEGRGLFPGISVLDNLLLGAYGRPGRGERQALLNEVFDLFPVLHTRRHQRAGALSGGEQQMVAIGRALMARPRLLLLDEPSLGLAPIMVHRIMELVSGLRRKGLTVVLAEQNVRQSLLVSDRAYVLEAGRITQAGSAGDLLASDHVQTAYLGL